jgi:very-short-patch-repair endonuclease
VLAGGPNAVASHFSAAWLWGYVEHWQPPLEISLPTGDRRPRHIITHRCPSLQPRDVTHQRGIPTTSRARTALDLAPRLTNKQLTRLVNDQLREKHLRPAALKDIIERNPLHPGTKLLRLFIQNPRNPTDSPFEDDFLAFVKQYDLPMPQTNIRLHGRDVDVFYPEANLIVELDGEDFHDHLHAFRDDRERDTENLKHGLVTMRMTTDRLKLTPGYEAERLLEIYTGRVGYQAAMAARTRASRTAADSVSMS